jgi:hypothetical protein
MRREWSSSIERFLPSRLWSAPAGNGVDGRKMPVLFANAKLLPRASGTVSVISTTGDAVQSTKRSIGSLERRTIRGNFLTVRPENPTYKK